MEGLFELDIKHGRKINSEKEIRKYRGEKEKKKVEKRNSDAFECLFNQKKVGITSIDHTHWI